MSIPKNDNYQAYLLRFWRDDDTTPWRALLQDPVSGETYPFSSMTHLIEFLKQQTASDGSTTTGSYNMRKK